MSLVREFMTPSVLTVPEEAPLGEVLGILRTNDVSSVVVTDPAGKPAGVVSLTDLMRVSRIEGGVRGDALEILPPDRRARDVMRSPLATVDEAATVGEAAARMLADRVHRVFVTRSGRAGELVGVFSTRDAMRVAMAKRIESPISDLMTVPARTVAIGDSIESAIQALDASNLRGLVVVDGEVPVGVFTQHEAIRARALSVELRAKDPVEEVMSYEAIALDQSTPLFRAAGYAVSMRVRRILAVEGPSRKLRGILTGYDLARVLA